LKTLSTWFTACLLIFTLHAAALPGTPGDFGAPATLPGAAPQFLPVEQAYQVAPRIDDNRLVLDWLIAPGYYLYQERFAVSLADGAALPLDFEPGQTQYDDYYQRELVVYYDATMTRSAPLPAADNLQIRVQSQGCADAGLCYPPRDQYFEADLTTGSVTEIAPPAVPPTAPATALPLYTALLFAMLGGVILNLMPCVFPVLSIKALSLTNSGLSTRKRHYHGLAYTAGVISTFIAIATLLISLRAGGEALGWGFQLQSPLFITALIYLFFVMGLGFSGILEAGAGLMNIGQSTTEGQGLRQSYATGILAAVVASPCTAPFMGTALGAALTQPAPVALTIFAGLGFGMAFPFLLLSWLPGLASRLPRPGAWMETFKQALAFPLYLTSVWLLWVLGRQAGADAVAAVLAGLVFTALAIWLLAKRSGLRAASAAVALVIALALPLSATRPAQPALWEPYSAQRLAQLLAAERPVFVNLTADWCITCLANERVALSSADFAATLRSEGIAYLKGDWTNYNAEITALLNANGRNGVPLYLFYAAGQKTPAILPQILTPGLISEALTN
jgi:thiol:disulfide interchange protein DsbD